MHKNYFTSLLLFSVLDLGYNLTTYLHIYCIQSFLGNLSFLISHGRETIKGGNYLKRFLSLNWQSKEGKFCMEDIIWGNTEYLASSFIFKRICRLSSQISYFWQNLIFVKINGVFLRKRDKNIIWEVVTYLKSKKERWYFHVSSEQWQLSIIH